MNDSNPYNEFNNMIQDYLLPLRIGKSFDFTKIIKMASHLPKPSTDANYLEMIDSGIAFSISDLLFNYFSNHYVADNNLEKKNTKLKNRITFYLTDLWEIWENLFIKQSWNHYGSFLSQSEEFKNRAAFINSHYNTLFNKCGDCTNTSIKIPLENRTSPMLQLDKLGDVIRLTRSTLTGCEGFVFASEILKNEKVFESVYLHWKTPSIIRMQLLWIPFISCSGELNRKDILMDIFQEMKVNYREIDFINVIIFLYAANKAGADEIIKYFDTLNSPSQWNILTPHNPLLDSLISSFSIKKDSLESLKLEHRSIEGTFWTEIFKNYFDMTSQNYESLYYESKNIIGFSKKSIDDWCMSISFAQETYVRELRTRIYDEFIRQFSIYDYLNEDNFIKEILIGNVSAQIKRYQEKISAIVMGQAIESIRCDVPESGFLPFIDFFLSTHLSFLTNRENFYQWKNISEVKSVFYKKAEELFESLNVNLVTDDGWLEFIRLLLKRIQNNVSVNLSKIFLAEFHSIKRIFVENYEKVFCDTDIQLAARHDLSTDARKYIRNISIKLPKYKISEPLPVDIKPDIKKYLLTALIPSKTNICPCDSGIYIAGYDGICDDYLGPLFTEIQSNAKKALKGINKPNFRHYEINLHQGENEFSKYVILSVSNYFLKNNEALSIDPVSTGIGLKNIQYYATFFQKGELHGWAEFKTACKQKYGFFTVKIYFPLWES